MARYVLKYWGVAQLAAQRILTPKVTGSIPVSPANIGKCMKVLFLDIDGVLNSTRLMLNLKDAGIDFRHYIHMDPLSMSVLNRILKESGAKVVISSSWRIAYPLSFIRSVMEQNGFVGEVIDCTPKGHNFGRVRGDEIAHWLKQHPEVTHFAIVDDDSDMSHLMHKLVQTRHATGLLEEHFAPLMKHLT